MQVVSVGTSVLSTCLQLTRALVRVAARKRAAIWPVEQSLPVAGIDILTAQSVLFLLRQSLTTDEVKISEQPLRRLSRKISAVVSIPASGV